MSGAKETSGTPIRCLLVGDSLSDRVALMETYASGEFHGESMQAGSCFPTDVHNIVVDGVTVELTLSCDISMQPDHEESRQFAYLEADVLVFC